MRGPRRDLCCESRPTGPAPTPSWAARTCHRPRFGHQA